MSVTFAVIAGGGALTGPATVTTDASGIATVGGWTLGPAAGPDSNTLQATSTGLSGSPVSFTATGTAGPATTIAAHAGDGQSAAVGTAVSTPPSVLVTDAYGNPVAGVSVTFAVTAGGGALTGPATVTTDASGIATVGGWTLGPAAGPDANTLQATSTGLSGSPVSFTATGTAGSATTIAAHAGDGQSAAVGTAVSTPPSVLVTDAYGNPVAGVSVTFAVTAGGGALTGPATVTTDASGIATVGGWTLGPAAGPDANTLQATSTGLSGSPVSFTATGTAGSATTIAAHAGDGQSAAVGTAVSTPPSVLVTDAYGNPVAGVSVTFAVTAGGGALTGPATVTTDASGIATVGGWTLGPAAGPDANTLQATSTGLSGSPVSFTATGTAGSATTIAAHAGDGQSAAVGTAVSTPPSVLVTDAYGNPVAGVSVTFAVTAGGGALTGPATVTTDASGIATVGGWTLGPAAGPDANTLQATSTGLSGSPVSFTATGTAGSATTIAAHAGDGQSAAVGTAVSTPPSVLVTDAYGNPVAGVSVTFAVTAGGGALTGPATVTTDASGIATVGGWTLGPAAGPDANTLQATSTGLSGSPVSFTATGTAGPATTIAAHAGDGQSAAVGTAVSTPPSVLVTDAYGNPVAGVSVTFAVTAGGGALTGPATVTTDASGIATVGGWTLGPAAGPDANTLQATSTGLSGSPVSFTATGTAGPATQLLVNAPDTATAGQAFNVTVTAEDAYGNTATGYAGAVALGSSDSAATLPSNYTFTSGDNGTHTFIDGVTLNTAGAQAVMATDTVDSNISGESGQIAVSAD